MHSMRAFKRSVVFSAAIGVAMLGQADKAMAAGQDIVQQEKHTVELAVVRPDNEAGQEAQQKVTLELVAADARVVKGKPYSADTSTETEQVLADGNRIVHRNVSRFYRDSDGRTRREQTFGNVDPAHPTPHEVKIFIDDPVNGTAFVLDPGSNSADKVQRTRRFLDDRNGEGEGTTHIFFKSQEGGDAAESGPPEPPGAPGRMMIKFRDEHSGEPNVLVAPTSDEKRDVSKEDLGTRTIEGVDCTGTRNTITIPAGAIGNEKPIAIVTETWYAAAIASVVESTTDDPRYGKTTYRLANVQLSEPARSLFEPPANFKVSTRK